MEMRFPWETDQASAEPPLPMPEVKIAPKRRGRRPAETRLSETTTAGWLYHHLNLTGPSERIASFSFASRGAGIIPWQIDLGRLEEDVFNLAATQPAHMRRLTVDGCRRLARQFREQIETCSARAAALVGVSQACPFDLHTLCPVPDAILQLGPSAPASLEWLSKHWGTTSRLHQVVVLPVAPKAKRLKVGDAVISYGFFTHGLTPYAAIKQLGISWPDIRFTLLPRLPAS